MNKLEQDVLKASKALVRVNGIDAGFLEKIASDEYRFSYSDSYLLLPDPTPPVSLALPRRQTPYISETLHPFFDNLLFEGEQLRLAEKEFGLRHQSHVDRFKLLMLTGQRTLGAVTVFPLIDARPIDFSDQSDFKLQFKTSLLRLRPAYGEACPVCLRPFPKGLGHTSCLKAFWNSTRSIHMETFEEDPQNIFRSILPGQSISGAQRKALFGLNSKRVLERTASPTHILKPDGDFPEMPANEHLTMSIARHLKFNTTLCALYKIERIGLVYITKRFDMDTLGNVYAVEDMAQLAEELAENKDRASLNIVAEIIRRYASSPVLEMADFFRRILFCFLIGNGDMHLKNWSLQYRLPSGLIKLAPVYDFLNVRASYPQERVETILSLNGKQNNLTQDDFKIFANKTLQLNDTFIRETLAQLPKWVGIIEDFCSRSLLDPERKKVFFKIVKERFERLAT